MKLKLFTLSIILLFLLTSVSASDFDNFTITQDHFPVNESLNLTIPSDYYIVNESENFTILEKDSYHTISISILDENTNKDILKHMLENSMYDFTYSKNYAKGDYLIEENYYNQEYQRGILYLCDDGRGLIAIDYKVPVIEDVSDSPVELILEGLN